MRNRTRTPKHCFHKPSGKGYVRLSGKTFYTGVWGTEEANSHFDRLLTEWLAHGRSLPSLEHRGADYWLHPGTYYWKRSRFSLVEVSLDYDHGKGLQ